MREEYLHFVWKYKRLPLHLVRTVSGETLEVVFQGFHNENENGPDFHTGKIKIKDVLWCGNIELHLKSSDWYKHKHHLDANYENVILHVVLKHDQDVWIGDRLLPTLELKDIIDLDHLQQFESFKSNLQTIVCSKQIASVDPIFVEQMMSRAFHLRMQRKISTLFERGIDNHEEVLYFLLARAFGQKVNQLPFEELTYRLPYSLLKQLSSVKRKSAIQYFSGLFEIELQNDGYNPTRAISSVAWKRSGMRPPSQPNIRIEQFATLICNWNLEWSFAKKDVTAIQLYFKALFHEMNKFCNHKMSEDFEKSIVINAVVPFLWWLAERDEDEKFMDLAISVLENYAEEKNQITAQWKEIGIRAKNSYESQALMEIFNEFCKRKKCLQCDVGIKLLRQ